jgi:hypothetical protein
MIREQERVWLGQEDSMRLPRLPESRPGSLPHISKGNFLATAPDEMTLDTASHADRTRTAPVLLQC